MPQMSEISIEFELVTHGGRRINVHIVQEVDEEDLGVVMDLLINLQKNVIYEV